MELWLPISLDSLGQEEETTVAPESLRISRGTLILVNNSSASALQGYRRCGIGAGVSVP